MDLHELNNIIREEVINMINEAWYSHTATPHFSKSDVHRELGSNPLTVDNGGHSSRDTLIQASTVDFNGANFKGEEVVLSDNKFTIYKIKNFGNDNISSTMSLFGKGANGEKELRKAIDTLNGAATRNNRSLKYRIIKTPNSRNNMINTFWEFSFDNGNTWYIMKPNPVQNMIVSKLVKK